MDKKKTLLSIGLLAGCTLSWNLATGQTGSGVQSPGWHFTPPIPLFAGGLFKQPPGQPFLAVGPRGHVFVACWDSDPATNLYDVYVRVREPHGSFGDARKVSKEGWGGTDDRSPRAAVSPSGVVVIAWKGTNGGSPGVKLSMSSDDGKTFSKGVVVSGSQVVLNLDIAFDPWEALHVNFSAENAKGRRDLFYTRSLGARAGGGGGAPLTSIDPAEFTPIENLTRDPERQFNAYVAADGIGNVYVPINSYTDTTPVVGELLIRNQRWSIRHRLGEFHYMGPASTSPSGLAVVPFTVTEYDPTGINTYLMRVIGGRSFLPVVRVPLLFYGGVNDGEGITVKDDGTIVAVLQTFDEDYDTFVEILMSKDFGESWLEPFLIRSWFAGPDGYRAVGTSADLDSNDTIHIAWLGWFVEGSRGDHVLYMTARYE